MSTHHVVDNSLTLCQAKVDSLLKIVEDLQAGFQSAKAQRRLWALCRAASEEKQLKEFRVSLAETKSTIGIAYLTSIQDQSNETLKALQLVRSQQDQVERLMTHLVQGIDDLQSQRSADIVTMIHTDEGIGWHSKDLHANMEAVSERIPNQITRHGFNLTSQTGFRHHQIDLRRSIKENFKKKHLCSKRYTTVFGVVIFEKKVIRKSVQIDGVFETQAKTTSSFTFRPAIWLVNLGFRYGVSVYSQAGCAFAIRPVRSVPYDTPLFRFSTTGNVDAVRGIIQHSEGFIDDVDPNGSTALHVSSEIL